MFEFLDPIERRHRLFFLVNHRRPALTWSVTPSLQGSKTSRTTSIIDDAVRNLIVNMVALKLPHLSNISFPPQYASLRHDHPHYPKSEALRARAKLTEDFWMTRVKQTSCSR